MAGKEVNADDIKVSNEAFSYLRLQKGKLQPLEHDRKAWEAAYRQQLTETFSVLRPHLPVMEHVGADCFLDVGSGLGGIDILIHRHYGGEMTPILMDGIADAPLARSTKNGNLHAHTFSHAAVADAFMRDNGVIPVMFVDPRMPQPLSVPVPLVVSFGAWCFHFPPEMYLDYVKANVRKGATLILDVRKSKPEWMELLSGVFELRTTITVSSDKLVRCVFKAR